MNILHNGAHIQASGTPVAPPPAMELAPIIVPTPLRPVEYRIDGDPVGSVGIRVLDIVADPALMLATRGVGQNAHVVTIKAVASSPPSLYAYTILYPTGIPGTFSSTAAAIAAARASAPVIGNYGIVTGLPYLPGDVYVGFKTNENPILNVFTGGATLTGTQTYVDHYFAPAAPSGIDDATTDPTFPPEFSGVYCASLHLIFGASAGSGLSYLSRINDPLITGNNVDTTAWGPYLLDLAPPTYTPSFPILGNNCPYIGGTALYAPFTIIRAVPL